MPSLSHLSFSQHTDEKKAERKYCWNKLLVSPLRAAPLFYHLKHKHAITNPAVEIMFTYLKFATADVFCEKCHAAVIIFFISIMTTFFNEGCKMFRLNASAKHSPSFAFVQYLLVQTKVQHYKCGFWLCLGTQGTWVQGSSPCAWITELSRFKF